MKLKGGKKAESEISRGGKRIVFSQSFISVYLFYVEFTFCCCKESFSMGLGWVSDRILKFISLEYHESIMREKMYYSIILEEKSWKGI